jgi:hypothetical protein
MPRSQQLRHGAKHLYLHSQSTVAVVVHRSHKGSCWQHAPGADHYLQMTASISSLPLPMGISTDFLLEAMTVALRCDVIGTANRQPAPLRSEDRVTWLDSMVLQRPTDSVYCKHTNLQRGNVVATTATAARLPAGRLVIASDSNMPDHAQQPTRREPGSFNTCAISWCTCWFCRCRCGSHSVHLPPRTSKGCSSFLILLLERGRETC